MRHVLTLRGLDVVVSGPLSPMYTSTLGTTPLLSAAMQNFQHLAMSSLKSMSRALEPCLPLHSTVSGTAMGCSGDAPLR